MNTILRFFPDLSELQKEQFATLGPFYAEWNSKINVISRKDIDNLYERHVLHALAIAKVVPFKPYTRILDVGTGGGFPGIPLAILFPNCRFHLIDSIGKKIDVVHAAIEALDLKNVTAEKARVQSLRPPCYDFIVARGVTKTKSLIEWCKEILAKEDDGEYNKLPNGYLFLKGGNLTEELKQVKGKKRQFPISEIFPGIEWFDQKVVLYVRGK